MRAVILETFCYSLFMYINRQISVMRFANSLKDVTLKSWNPLAQSNQYYLVYHLLVKFGLLQGPNAFLVFREVVGRKINAEYQGFLYCV